MQRNEILDVLSVITENNFIKATISNKASQIGTYNKICIKRLDIGFQAEKFTDKQAFHERISVGTLVDYMCDQLLENFRQLNIVCDSFDFELKISKKGKILTNRKNKEASPLPEFAEHNRKKNYIISEKEFVPALFELGVITKEGKIVASKYDKFKQINRFIECIDDALKNEQKETLDIIDFGCGKSYLTFVLYHYITKIKNKSANIIGLDLKKDVIEKCNTVAKKYGYSGMNFICGDIKDFKPKNAPDMVVTLHACDTATDYALYNAVCWQSKYIFSVPCCQHELNSNISCETLSVVCDYGLIKERFCALATDAIRAKLLEASGYKTDILEFIDMDNSPKNILIRAQKKKSVNTHKRKALKSEIESFSNMLGHNMTLYKLFNDNNLI